jgi:hypothetical protein
MVRREAMGPVPEGGEVLELDEVVSARRNDGRAAAGRCAQAGEKEVMQ